MIIRIQYAEYALGIDESRKLEFLTEGALIALGHYTLHQIQWTRFGKLLLALRGLSLRGFDSYLQTIFHTVIDDLLGDNKLATAHNTKK